MKLFHLVNWGFSTLLYARQRIRCLGPFVSVLYYTTDDDCSTLLSTDSVLLVFARFAYTILLPKEDLLFQLILGSHQSRQLLRIRMDILSILGPEQET